MTELTLIFVFQASGILLSLALARFSGTGAPLGSVRRIEAAIQRAADTFLRRGGMRLGVVCTGAALVALAVGVLAQNPFAGALGAFGVVLGAGVAAGSAWTGTALLGRSSGAVVVAAERRFDLTLANALLPRGAAGIFAQTLGALGALGLFLMELRLHGATPSSQPFAVASLPGFALGAALTALVAEGSSAVYRAAGDGGVDAAARHERALTAWDPQNPALVSLLVGEKLAAGSRAAFVAASSAAATSVVLVLSTRAGGQPYEQVRLAALPLVLSAFGLVASVTGVWVARPLEAEGAAPPLLRGQVSAMVIWLFGLAGACHWLFPECWTWLIGAGAVGLFGTALVLGLLFAATQRRAAPVEDSADALRSGSLVATAAALSGGLSLAAVVLALVGALALAARALGAATTLAVGPTLGLVTALAGALALAPFAFAVETLAAGAASARAVGAMTGTDPDTARRLTRLAESSQPPAALARGMLFITAALASLVVCLLPNGRSPDAAVPAGGGLLLGWLALLGAACLLAQAAATLRRAARAAREQTVEVGRKLASFREKTPEAGENGATSYRACEELSSRLGLAASLPLAAGAALGMVLLGSGLYLVYRMGGPRLAADALAMFVAGAAVTALGAALTVDGAHAVLAAARRASRPEADRATFAASVTGNALLNLLQNAIGPTVCSLALIAASLALLLSPLLP